MAKKAETNLKPARLKPHPLIASIVKDAARPPRLRVVRGYIGESSEKNHVRIYLNLELRHYIDVPTDGIAHTQESTDAALPLGGTYVWIFEQANVRHGGSVAAPEDPSTMATGEEGDPPTTMATGEESSGIGNPWDPVINPFGRF